MYENILYEVDGGVATITLNQPDKRNALSHGMLDDMIKGFEAARDDEAVRVVILTGAGKVFSAGGDLSGFSADLPLAHKHYGSRKLALIGEKGRSGDRKKQPLLVRPYVPEKAFDNALLAQGHLNRQLLGLYDAAFFIAERA